MDELRLTNDMIGSFEIVNAIVGVMAVAELGMLDQKQVADILAISERTYYNYKKQLKPSILHKASSLAERALLDPSFLDNLNRDGLKERIEKINAEINE